MTRSRAVPLHIPRWTDGRTKSHNTIYTALTQTRVVKIWYICAWVIQRHYKKCHSTEHTISYFSFLISISSFIYSHSRTKCWNIHPFNSPFLRQPRWAGTRKVKPILILLKQETVSGSGISWATCKSAPRSRQITMPASHHSVFYRPDALPAAQPTASKHWRLSNAENCVKICPVDVEIIGLTEIIKKERKKDTCLPGGQIIT